MVVACVKPPFTLLKKPVKVVGLYAIKLAQMTFSLVPKVFDSIDMILLIGKQFRVVDSHVMKVAYVQSIVGFKSIGIHNAIRLNFLFNDWQECFCFCIGYNRCIYLATPL